MANTTGYGILMNDYKSIYEREYTSCTQSTYDLDYSRAYGTVPSGPGTYANASKVVPKSMTATIIPLSSDTYNITYITIAQSGKTPALRIVFNSTGQYVTSSIFEGVFLDQNYQSASSNYKAINNSDSCSVWV